MKFFLEMGPFLYPMLIFISLALYNTIKYGGRVIRRRVEDEILVNMGLDSIVFWGGITLVTGVLGQILGIYSALREIAAATDISPTLIMYGLSVSFTTTIFGFGTFIISALVWYILKRLYRGLIKVEK